MKLKITFKDPNASDQIMNQCKHLGEDQREAIANKAAEWFRWGEYVNVELDTESDTCKVLKKF